MTAPTARELTAQIDDLLVAYANATPEERQRLHDAMAAAGGMTCDEAAEAAVRLVNAFSSQEGQS